MADVKWIKLMTDVFDNRKIKQIECMPDGDTLIVIWFKLLALAGQINDGGLVYFTKDIPYTDQLLSSQFNRPIATIQMALNLFEKFEMIEIVDSLIMVSNWEKYQNVASLERVREQTRRRVSAYRTRKKEALLQSVTENVTLRNAIEKEEEIENKSKNNNICANNVRKSDDCASYECANAQDDTCAKYSDHFEEVWKLYPRKKDKGRAYKAYKARLASGWSEDELKRAVEGYASECKREHTPEKYIKHPSTFFSADTPFTDYLKENKTSTNWGIDEDDPYGIKEG